MTEPSPKMEIKIEVEPDSSFSEKVKKEPVDFDWKEEFLIENPTKTKEETSDFTSTTSNKNRASSSRKRNHAALELIDTDFPGKEIKLEPVEQAKEKSDEFYMAYPDSLEPKLEEIEEVDYSDMNYPSTSSDPYHGSVEESVKSEEVEELVVDVKTVPSPLQTIQCNLCQSMQVPDDVTTLFIPNRILVLMVGLLASKITDLRGANHFLFKLVDPVVCKQHLMEAIEGIFGILKITKLENMRSAAGVLIFNLMEHVRLLSPNMKMVQFQKCLVNFIREVNPPEGAFDRIMEKTDVTENCVVTDSMHATPSFQTRRKTRQQSPKNAKPVTPSPLDQVRLRRHCDVCNMMEPLTDIICLSDANRKLALMIGLIFHGRKEVKTAKKWLSQESDPFVGKIHLWEAVGGIFRSLNIKHISEFNCSLTFVRPWKIARQLVPMIGIAALQSLLTEFIRKIGTYVDQGAVRGVESCLICSRVIIPIKQPSCDDEIVILAMCVLRNEISLNKAKLLIGDHRPKSICVFHYPSTSDTICKYFDVKSTEVVQWKQEIESCPPDLSEDFISIVNSIAPNIPRERVLQMFVRFLEKQSKPVNVMITGSSMNHPLGLAREYRCAVCWLEPKIWDATSLDDKNKQLVLSVGLIVNGRKAIPQARHLISADEVYVCKSHLQESISAIFQFLKINNIYELHLYSRENFESLMRTVRKLSPNCGFEHFCKCLNTFN